MKIDEHYSVDLLDTLGKRLYLLCQRGPIRHLNPDRSLRVNTICRLRLSTKKFPVQRVAVIVAKFFFQICFLFGRKILSILKTVFLFFFFFFFFFFFCKIEVKSFRSHLL